MFLLERIFGFGVYMIILLFVCLLLVKTNITCKSILKGYLVCLCIMAFLYKPYITADLYRIFDAMNYFSTMDFQMFWKHYAFETSIPIARLLYWSFGKTGINELLPAFSAFVCYSVLFYIISKTKELYNVSKQNIAIVLFYVMTNSIYISVIGGIRMMLTLCLISFSYFRGTVEKKQGIIDVLFYGISIFIHAMGVVVIALCMLVSLFGSNSSSLKRLGYFFVAGIGSLIFVLNFNSILNGVYQKSVSYILGDMHSDVWEYLMGALILIATTVTFVEFWRETKKEKSCLIKNYNAVAKCCILLAICFCFEFSIFYRFCGHLAVLFSIPTVMYTLERTKGKQSIFIRGIDYRSLLILLSVVIAAISCTRGSLSALKFFEL